ncbi:MAG TPA: hypothetical protein VM689_08810 [Aliidongia sp.]|nr:hypothetical protein [Aliidongia sp.]
MELVSFLTTLGSWLFFSLVAGMSVVRLTIGAMELIGDHEKAERLARNFNHVTSYLR